ncbi:MAG: hypothetical protein PHR20_00470 [Bacteroidales bacterium]|nr:hypothetical protein [Bacteroidales bacterium]
MKRSDIITIIAVLAIISIFTLIPNTLASFNRLTTEHGLLMSFFKFAILGTFGEMLALRIRKGHYIEKGFGLLPRILIWGILGVVIASAMTIFKTGTVVLLEKGFKITRAGFWFAGGLSLGKAFVAMCISVLMNTLFAPVFMTFHKVTDIHIMETGGTLNGFFSNPLRIGDTLKNKINWDIQYGFIFKKTIPLFWYPAHTITFLLPGNYQVLFAAFLGIALGLILTIRR